ncbi:hypothetical protein M2132_002341 [Dysgonomonas sp. PH5-45]|uniref:hypothetical protein n=1 Tax=unclassified Dysgonomonas TaxID=2630389 RepID=UPI0024755EB7|nr:MULTISPECIES: hypothetical protein [unclassified Dysgonomonas]MDH6355990.1 hypothetical protein [Dysgonomonas sp. PH5-45]MDH6388885.1 hypothetical protein [Dysgonomonas sp. PH5-37]
MQIIEVPINKGEWLTTALKNKGYPNIPTNTILKKTLPGLGATYMEINDKISKRHSIIIEPNVPVILGKTKDKPELLAVWEKCTEAKIKKYIRDKDIKYKKILTTPEGYKKVRKAITDVWGEDIYYSTFFCLFDECEKLIQDVDYRNSIAQPINDFFRFTNKAFVSATTLNMTHPEFENLNFKILEVKPTYDYKKDLDLIITNTYETEILKKFKELKDSECICIFLNKTDSIDKLIHTQELEDESKVFCSDKSVKKLKEKGYKNVSDTIEFPLAKYNFFTCRFFSAVDIEIKQKPDILILTNLYDANHTMIDPFTEAIQIYGRFRKNKKYHGEENPFNSITHITNFDPHLKIKTREEIDSEIEAKKRNYNLLNDSITDQTTDIEKQIILRDIGLLSYSELLDENGNYNYFSQDNLYNEERVKGYYSDPQLLLQAYQDTNHFNINSIIYDAPFSIDFDILEMKKLKSAKEKREQIINNLERLIHQKEINPNFDIEPFKERFRREEITNKETGDFIIDCFDYLGKKEIERIGYTQVSKLKTALNKAKAEQKQKDLFLPIQDEIKKVYNIEDTPTKDDTKLLIEELYRLNGIDIKVTQTTIKLYCKTASSNDKKPPIYRIKEYKSEFGEESDSGGIGEIL